MLTAEFYHQLTRSRRTLPCPATRLYGDLLPLILVDATTPREYASDTRAKQQTLVKQMEKTVRTYYLHKQVVIGHLEGERRKLYKQALALHRAMLASNRRHRSTLKSEEGGGSSEFTLPPYNFTRESTRVTLMSERQTAATISKSEQFLSPTANSDERFSLADDELLIPSLTPDPMEKHFKDFLNSRVPAATAVHTINNNEERHSGNTSAAGSSVEHVEPSPGSAEVPPKEGGEKPASKKKVVKLFIENAADDDVFFGPHRQKLRWPKMIPQPALVESLETIAERPQSSSPIDNNSYSRRETITSGADEASEKLNVRVTITKSIKGANHMTISGNDGDEITAILPVNANSNSNSNNSQVPTTPNKPNNLTKNVKTTVVKAKLVTMPENVNNFKIRQNNNNNNLMFPKLTLTSKLTQPSSDVSTGFGTVSTGEQKGKINSESGTSGSSIVPAVNYYKLSLLSSDDNQEKRQNKRTKIHVRPLVPGKTRYIDWQLQSDGRYKSRIVTYDLPQFQFDTEQSGQADQNLQISGKQKTLKLLSTTSELLASRAKPSPVLAAVPPPTTPMLANNDQSQTSNLPSEEAYNNRTSIIINSEGWSNDFWRKGEKLHFESDSVAKLNLK